MHDPRLTPTLDDMLRACGMSGPHFSRFVELVTGVKIGHSTVWQWVKKSRTNRDAKLSHGHALATTLLAVLMTLPLEQRERLIASTRQKTRWWSFPPSYAVGRYRGPQLADPGRHAVRHHAGAR